MKCDIDGLRSLVIALTLLSTPAVADGDLAAGGDLADRLCARCHAIAGVGPSPVAGAPAFSGLAEKWPVDHLAEALAEGIVTRHRDDVRMPEFTLSPEQIEDLLA